MDDRLRELLPVCDMYKYTVESISDEQSFGKSSFTAIFTVNISTSEEFDAWKLKFESRSNTQFNFSRSTSCEGKYVSLKKRLKCHHNVQRGKLTVNKHTGCPAEIAVTIRNLPKRIRPDRTKLRPDGLCLVKLSWTHNHPIDSAYFRRKVSAATDSLLIRLFSNGHSALSAWSCVKLDLEDNLNADDVLEDVQAKRSVCPDYKHCHYIFSRVFENQYVYVDYLNKFDEFVDRLNSEAGEYSVASEICRERRIVAICTPFMKRVHEHVEESGQLVFVDSSRSFDKGDYRIFLLMTHSRAGALPLAVGIIHSDDADNAECLTQLFTLIKRVMPDYESFSSRGVNQGPTLIMADDRAAERAALRNVWPLSQLYLCPFHILQAQWKWLLLSSHEIEKDDRPILYEMFKKLLYAPTESELINCVNQFLDSQLVEKYQMFRTHIWNLYQEQRKEWCLAFCPTTLFERNHTSNYVEASMRVMKDRILQRTRSFDLVQFVHFVAERFSVHYQRRLLDFVHDRKQHASTEYPPYPGQSIEKKGESIYDIASSKQDGLVYTVNMNVASCSCHEGSLGNVCEHLHYILTEADDFVGISGDFNDCRELFLKLATCCSVPCELPKTLDIDDENQESNDSLREVEEESDTGVDQSESVLSIEQINSFLVKLENNNVSVRDEASIDNKSPSNGDIERQISKWNNLVKLRIHSLARSNPLEFAEAYKTSIRTLRSISTIEDAVSVLRSFGKCSSGSKAAKRRKLSTTTSSQSLYANKYEG